MTDKAEKVPCPCCGEPIDKWEDERGQAPCLQCLKDIIIP